MPRFHRRRVCGLNPYREQIQPRTHSTAVCSTSIRRRVATEAVADLHADSLLWGRNLLHRSTTGHVDVPRLQQAHTSLQAFTVVTTIPRNLNINRNSGSSDMVQCLAVAEGWPPRTWNSPKERALYQTGRLREFEAASGGQLVVLRSRSDLQKFMTSGEPHRVAVREPFSEHCHPCALSPVTLPDTQHFQ